MTDSKQQTRKELPIRLRGHTLLCVQGFRGEGYSSGFVQNFSAIHQRLQDNPKHLVEVIVGPDSICRACPHNGRQGCAIDGAGSEEVMKRQDREVLSRLGLESGSCVAWEAILDRICSSVTGADLPGLCGTCRWLPLGFCAEGIDRLRDSPVKPFPAIEETSPISFIKPSRS